MPVCHPLHDDAGQPVILKAPSRPSPLPCWEDPTAIASVVPDGPSAGVPERAGAGAMGRRQSEWAEMPLGGRWGDAGPDAYPR